MTEDRAFLEAIVRADMEARRHKPFDSLEELIISPDGFGLETATPLQRAICRIVDGIPLGELAEHPHVREAIGDVSVIEGVRPVKIVLVAGIRTFKSMLTAGAALWAALTCDVSRLGPGEVPRFSVVSLRKDLADVILRHLIGVMLARPMLRNLLVKEPTGDTVNIRHPSGREVEVKVVAGSRAGASLVARWMAGVAHDEAPRMVGQEEGIVNLDDSREAVEGRLLDGAQQFEIGSPWAPYGPVYETVVRHEGRPSRDCVVIRARADWLNPVWWTPERAETLRRRSPRAYQTDFLAMFADPEETLFPQSVLDRVAVLNESPFTPGHDYAAAMDPATRTNAWTLVVFTRGKDGVIRQVLARQWQRSRTEDVRPRAVLEEIWATIRPYGLEVVKTDQWSADALADIAQTIDERFYLFEQPWTSVDRSKIFLNLAKQCEQGLIELIDDPLVKKDLLMIKSKLSASGVQIILPRTPDGRHCDYGPAIAQCTADWLDRPADIAPEPGTPEHDAWIEEELEREELEFYESENNRPWWA